MTPPEGTAARSGPGARAPWLAAGSVGLALASAVVGGTLGPSWIGPAGGALALGGLLGGVAWGSADPGLRVFGPAITSARTGRPEVALTFDDGPDPASTPMLLEALERAGARATFFLLVDAAERHPELTRAIATSHEVGLHGLTHHPWLTVRPPDTGARELAEASRRLQGITGAPIRWFRPPFGAVSPRLMEAVRRAGLEHVWCSVRTRDGGRLEPADVRARCGRARAGDIVLLHDGRPPTAHALPDVLGDLRARGLAAVTVGDLCASS